jgi:protein gp37
MGKNTKIEWADHTINLWHGCQKVNAGCKNCYAEALSKRFDKGLDLWKNNGVRKEIPTAFPNLEKLQKSAALRSVKETVFVGSMMDIFEDARPTDRHSYTTDFLRGLLFYKIEKGDYDNLIFLFLTKRPENIYKYVPSSWSFVVPENVMFGVSVAEQKDLRNFRAFFDESFKKFISVEPQIEFIDLMDLLDCAPFDFCANAWFNKIDWVIQGGESGRSKRYFNIDWAYLLKIQCQRYHVPYFFKQIDKVKKIPSDLMVREFPKFFNKTNIYG